MGNVPATCIRDCIRARARALRLPVRVSTKIARTYVPVRKFRRKKVIKRAIIIPGRAEIHGHTGKKLTSFEPSSPLVTIPCHTSSPDNVAQFPDEISRIILPRGGGAPQDGRSTALDKTEVPFRRGAFKSSSVKSLAETSRK